MLALAGGHERDAGERCGFEVVRREFLLVLRGVYVERDAVEGDVGEGRERSRVFGGEALGFGVGGGRFGETAGFVSFVAFGEEAIGRGVVASGEAGWVGLGRGGGGRERGRD
ncbi:MAG TPA: hypothetical protein VGK73_15630 [Polyangiaceae bacterium]